MRLFLVFAVLALAACSPAEEQDHNVTGNVANDDVAAFLQALDEATDSPLNVSSLVALTKSVQLDEEKQEKFTVSLAGDNTEFLCRVWREQQDWVHLYLSTPSKELAALVDRELQISAMELASESQQ